MSSGTLCQARFAQVLCCVMPSRTCGVQDKVLSQDADAAPSGQAARQWRRAPTAALMFVHDRGAATKCAGLVADGGASARLDICAAVLTRATAETSLSGAIEYPAPHHSSTVHHENDR